MSGFAERVLYDFGPHVDPKVVRQCLDYSYLLLDVGRERRAELAAARAPLSERIVAAVVYHEILEANKRCHRWLARHARKGAGRSPALTGHGCPALPSAVGPALVRAAADIT